MNIVLKKCTLTNWKKEYISAIAHHANNPKIAQYLRDAFPAPYTEADALSWINLNQKNEVLTNLAITVQGNFAGTIGVVLKTDIHRCNAEIGYWIGEAYWGQGIVTEAVTYMISYTFKQFPHITRIYAGILDGNIASTKVLQKAGFEFEYIIKEGIIKNDVLFDEHIYSFRRSQLE